MRGEQTDRQTDRDRQRQRQTETEKGVGKQMGGGKGKEKERCEPGQRRGIASWLRFGRDSVQSALAESAIRSADEVGTSEGKPLNRKPHKAGHAH